MGQTWSLPVVTSTDTGLAAITNLSNGAESQATNFSGATAPSAGAFPYDWQFWVDTSASPSVLKIYNATGAAWVTLMDDVESAGGGGVLAAAGAFITLAPTSAVAGSSGTDLVRKGEVDVMGQVCLTRIGTLAASDNRYLGVFPATATIDEVYLISDTATSGSDVSNNYTIQVRNMTEAEDLMATAWTSNGSDIAADTGVALGLDQNQALDALSVLEVQITKTGTPTDLSSAEVAVVVNYSIAV